jgi:FtsZ-binding cell division protein ZapB
VLDPDFQAEAEAAARDIEIERHERIALSGAEELAAENEKLAKQIAGLSRRIAALIDENGTLKYTEKMWRERAVAAGWKGRADA